MSTTRRHVHEERFEGVSRERVFAVLHTPSAIREWWSAARAVVIPESDGIWAASWGDVEDDPEYSSAAVIRTFDPPHRMVLIDQRYTSKYHPLPFQAEFITTFEVESDASGQGAILRVVQDGFPVTPDADEFYAACGQGWRDTFAGIRMYLRQAES